MRKAEWWRSRRGVARTAGETDGIREDLRGLAGTIPRAVSAADGRTGVSLVVAGATEAILVARVSVAGIAQTVVGPRMVRAAVRPGAMAAPDIVVRDVRESAMPVAVEIVRGGRGAGANTAAKGVVSVRAEDLIVTGRAANVRVRVGAAMQSLVLRADAMRRGRRATDLRVARTGRGTGLPVGRRMDMVRGGLAAGLRGSAGTERDLAGWTRGGRSLGTPVRSAMTVIVRAGEIPSGAVRTAEVRGRIVTGCATREAGASVRAAARDRAEGIARRPLVKNDAGPAEEAGTATIVAVRAGRPVTAAIAMV